MKVTLMIFDQVVPKELVPLSLRNDLVFGRLLFLQNLVITKCYSDSLLITFGTDFRFVKGYPAKAVKIVKDAMAKWEQMTCIR